MGKSSAPAVIPSDNSEMMMQMMMMMSGMMESMNNSAPEAPVVDDAPEVDAPVEIDWRAKQDELNEKMRADYNDQAKDRKGRADTIHTSPLDDEEGTTTTDPDLSGDTENMTEDTAGSILG